MSEEKKDLGLLYFPAEKIAELEAKLAELTQCNKELEELSREQQKAIEKLEGNVVTLLIKDSFATCPKCGKETKWNNGVEWCGKNLRCEHCEYFSYYSDFIMSSPKEPSSQTDDIDEELEDCVFCETRTLRVKSIDKHVDYTTKYYVCDACGAGSHLTLPAPPEVDQ